MYINDRVPVPNAPLQPEAVEQWHPAGWNLKEAVLSFIFSQTLTGVIERKGMPGFYNLYHDKNIDILVFYLLIILSIRKINDFVRFFLRLRLTKQKKDGKKVL